MSVTIPCINNRNGIKIEITRITYTKGRQNTGNNAFILSKFNVTKIAFSHKQNPMFYIFKC